MRPIHLAGVLPTLVRGGWARDGNRVLAALPTEHDAAALHRADRQGRSEHITRLTGLGDSFYFIFV
jgi:hypothetical protein